MVIKEQPKCTKPQQRRVQKRAPRTSGRGKQATPSKQTDTQPKGKTKKASQGRVRAREDDNKPEARKPRAPPSTSHSKSKAQKALRHDLDWRKLAKSLGGECENAHTQLDRLLGKQIP